MKNREIDIKYSVCVCVCVFPLLVIYVPLCLVLVTTRLMKGVEAPPTKGGLGGCKTPPAKNL